MYTCISISLSLSLSLYIYIYICMHIYIYIHVCIHIYTHIYLYECIYIYMYIYIYIYIRRSALLIGNPTNRGEVKSKTPEGVFADFHRFLFLCVFIGLSRFFTGFHRFVFLPLDLSPSFVGLLLIPVSVNKTLL